MIIQLLILAPLLNFGITQNIHEYILGDIIGFVSGLALDHINCTHSPQVLESNINYLLYTPNNRENPIYLTSDNLYEVDPSLKVKFIIHGWLETGSRFWVSIMKEHYLESQEVNVISIDWSYYAFNVIYAHSVCALPGIGEFVGKLITRLEGDNNVPLSNIFITGFSLGAHIAGYAGQIVQDLTGGRKIGQINGLDPAGPGFTGKPTNQRLDKDDAVFVQAIHTSSGKSGYAGAIGTVDFHVGCGPFSCGSTQLGCPSNPSVPSGSLFETTIYTVACNHFRAISYFLESIYWKNFLGFPQTKCFGYRTSDIGTIMGEHCPTTATGSLYLSVNFNYPFGKGDRGKCNIL